MGILHGHVPFLFDHFNQIVNVPKQTHLFTLYFSQSGTATHTPQTPPPYPPFPAFTPTPAPSPHLSDPTNPPFHATYHNLYIYNPHSHIQNLYTPYDDPHILTQHPKATTKHPTTHPSTPLHPNPRPISTTHTSTPLHPYPPTPLVPHPNTPTPQHPHTPIPPLGGRVTSMDMEVVDGLRG